MDPLRLSDVSGNRQGARTQQGVTAASGAAGAEADETDAGESPAEASAADESPAEPNPGEPSPVEPNPVEPNPVEPSPVEPNPTARTVHPRWPRAVVFTALAVIAADQLTKWWALERLSRGRLIFVVGSLRFNLAFNTGTAFSLGSGLGPIIAVVAVLISFALLWTARSMLKTSSLLAVGLVVGGALGNFIDRAFRAPLAGTDSGLFGGAVVDFIDVQWWPIFNIADAGIVVGGILIVLLGGFGPPPEPKRSK